MRPIPIMSTETLASCAETRQTGAAKTSAANLKLALSCADPCASHPVLAKIAMRRLGACLNSRCSILGESDSTLGYEQVFSSLEYRSDAASAAECAGLRAERPCLAVYR